MNFYDLNAKFGNYELSRMKWVFDWGSLLFMMTKNFFFLVKLLYIFFTVRGRMDIKYPIRSDLTRLCTHKSILDLHGY